MIGSHDERIPVTVGYQRDGDVVVITIRRPERKNAIDGATARALGDCWRRFEEDDDALVGVLTGEGGTFCAGADLVAFDLEDHPDGFLGFTRLHISKPTIAAVEGHAVAGGLELALWCDLRVAAESAVFGCFERRFGVPLVDGGTQRLPRMVGMGRAMEMMLTGRPVAADEALRIGLVNRVVPSGRSLDAALRLAADIARFPQATVRSDRAAALEGWGRPIDDALEIERRHGLEVMDTAVDGARRFAGGQGRHGEGVEPRC